jgi:hypothetical protein
LRARRGCARERAPPESCGARTCRRTVWLPSPGLVCPCKCSSKRIVGANLFDDRRATLIWNKSQGRPSHGAEIRERGPPLEAALLPSPLHIPNDPVFVYFLMYASRFRSVSRIFSFADCLCASEGGARRGFFIVGLKKVGPLFGCRAILKSPKTESGYC